jgi:asparagine N-glycosylation enzyme membrane subunit Stt3
MDIFSGKYNFFDLISSLSSGIASLTLIIMIIHYFIIKSNFFEINFFKKSKIPRTIWSVIISLVLLALLSIIILGPSFLIEKLQAIHQTIFKPVLGRWNITVAENRQPSFNEWSGSFGPFFRGIPLMFWLFFVGSVVLFKKMLVKIKKKDSMILILSYVFFLLGLVFSRYSGNSLFNGENFISKAFYYFSSILFIAVLIYYYVKYDNNGNRGFKNIKYEYILLFSLFVLTIFTARGAVRLIMVLGPIAPIMVAFLIVESIDRLVKAKDQTWRIIIGVCVLIILISSLYTFNAYYQSVKGQAYSFVPSAYNIQWQKGMEWVRDNTPENAVFGHWWDYGYWVQSIGKRATSVDGGNAITYWNYLMGRHVLVGDNQDDALEFLYNHNTTHFLIDSTDVGKYTAFSSIGSDANFDRYSWIGTYLLDESQTQETSDTKLFVYNGGVGVDEDFVIKKDDKEILIPANSAGIGAIVTPVIGDSNYQQPYIIVVYQGQQHNVELRYLYIGDRLLDFESGIEAAAFIYPRLNQQNGGISLDPKGAAFYLSPRLLRGMLAQVYLLDDPFDNFPGFKLVRSEPSLVIGDLRNQGMALPDFVYYNGLQGPIKIWEIEYTGKEQYREDYVDTDASKYLDWVL